MIGSYLILAVLGFILISTFTAHYNQNYLEQYYAAALRRESSQIADSFGNSYYRSELTLEEFQKQIAAVSSYLDADIYIVTTGGRVLITSEQYIRPSETESIKDFDILDFSGSNYSIGTFYDHYDDDVLTVYTPITRSYKVTCYAIICLPLSHITTLQYDLLNGFYLSLIFLLLLALIILLTFIFAVYRPLQVIIRAARNYADGNFDTALEMERQDEIGTLADTLHFMALELNALDNDQHKFVSNVSHDFRSPLTSIKGYAQAMADGTASITRESTTMQTETHYYAMRIDTPEGAQVLRVGEDVANIWGLSTDTLPLLCGAVVLILCAATLFSWWLTRRMVQPINHLAEHLDTIEADVPYEELIPLARTIQTDRKLREDNETMRREFTANVSHELKTPLTSISGYAELIETGMAKPADVPTFAARIHKEAQRMIALVSDILQLSELDGTQASRSREPVTEMTPVDLAALVKETAQNMTVNARRAYVTLQYDARPATVRGSRDQLSELTQNLFDNAIRFIRPGGHVELRCGVGGDGCPYFEVEDNGIGIPQDSQTRVFERFYRVDKSRSKATGGTGLGLAIVKHIALLHDAKIDLQSQVGTGTTIRGSFPKNS